MKNFGTVIDNFDAVTKQYVDNKASTERIKGIKVDNATLADTAKKVQNAFTYKAHNKAAGTVVPITYDGSQAASLDFSANDFTYDYSSGKDIKIKLVDKDYATVAQVNGKYTKPESGIPKSDLAEDVKTSLGKADTALQSAPVTSVNGKTGDVTLGAGDVGALPSSTKFVSSVNGQSGAVTGLATTSEVNAKYTKPSDGIPKSDLASSVQTSLGKADTALQSAPVTSVNGKTGDVTGLATKDEVNAKQNALTETQLAAVDSGITEAKRTKYDGYEEIINQKANSADLATVATSGNYNDLLNKPTIPTDYVPNTRKVNNKALSSDITLGASDVGALPTAGGTVTGNLTVGGNLTVNGTTTTVDSTTLQVKDKLIEVAHGNTEKLTSPAGIVAPKYDGTNSGALVFNGDGIASVGDVVLDASGNIDVTQSNLQPLATRTGLVNDNLVKYDGTNQTLVDTGKKISDFATVAQVNAKYTKPESGIPKSDLATSVQTSLDKADSALQSAPVTSVNGKTGAVQLGASDVGALPTSTKYVVSVNGESGEVKNIAKTNSANTFTGDQTVTGNGSVSGNFTVGGNLTVNGTTTTVDSTTLQVKDKLIEVAHGNTTTLTTPAGLVAPKYDGTNSGALVFDSTGTAYVGDVTLKDGNIDVANSGLQPLATRTGLVGGNLVQYDSSALTLKDSGKKISDLATTSQVNAKYTKPSGGIPKTDLASDVQTSLGKADSALQAKDISGKANLEGGNTFSGNQVITGYLDIRGIAAEKHLKTRGIGGSDGNGNNSDLYLQYSSDYKTYFGKTGQSSLNADGSISINGKTAATTDQIPAAANNGTLTIQKNGTTVQTFTANQSSSVTANITVPTKVSELANDSEFITSDGSVKSVIDFGDANNRIKIGYTGAGITGNAIKYIAGYTAGDSESVARIKDIDKASMKNWLGYATVATSGSYNDLSDTPTNYVTTDTTQTISGAKTFVSNIYISQTRGQNAGITWQSASDKTNRGIFRNYDDGTTENFVTQSNGFLFRPLNNKNTKAIKVDPVVGALYPEKNLGADLGKTAQRWNNAYIQNIHADNIPFDSNGLSTGTLSSTQFTDGDRIYIERDITTDRITTHVDFVLDVNGTSEQYAPILKSNGIYFVKCTFTNAGSVGSTSLYTVYMSLYNSSGSAVTDSNVLNGTFKYKKLN